MSLITVTSFRTARVAFLTALVLSVMANSVLAGPIVGDSFDYPVGNLDGNEGGIGWRPGDPWDVGVQAELTGSATVESGSLVLSSGYATSGNRLRLSATASTAASSLKFVTATRQVGTDVGEVGGDLWLSFLYKRIDDTFNGYDFENNLSDGIQTEIRNNSGGIIMRARAKRQNTDGIQNRYHEHTDGETIESPDINDGGTFLFVVRYQNLAETGIGPLTGINRRAQMWVMDGAGYDAVAASPSGASNLYSEAHTIAHAINGNDTVDRLLKHNFVGFWHLYYARAAVTGVPGLGGDFIADFDELRWGDSIDDVLPGFTDLQIGTVPEPSSCMLVGLACLSLIGLRRRQQ